MQNLIIDPEFKTHIAPLRKEEYEQLEERLVEDGCRDPLVVWNDTIVDGHNRYEICNRLGIEYKTFVKHFSDRDAALDWIECNQISRRNITPEQFKLYLGRRYNRLKAQGKRNDVTSPQNGDKLKTSEKLATEHGVSKNTVERAGAAAATIDEQGAPELVEAVETGQVPMSAAAEVATLSVSEQEEVVARGEAEILKKARDIRAGVIEKRKKERAQQAAELAENCEVIGDQKKYRVIYADPPWDYGDKRTGLAGYSAAVDHYPAMTIKELCDLPVHKLATDDAVLFLWVTSPLLVEALPVIDAWGFKYKASYIWDKVKHNVGHYNSVRHEFLLICTRGSCTPDEKTLHDSVQTIERSNRHSEKPEKFRELIDGMYTVGTKIELFRRGSAPDGWEIWGNETNAA